MLSALRQGTPIYVLYKNELRVAVGEVVSVSTPVPQFGTTYTAGILAQPKMTVDIKVRFGSDTVDFQKLPSDQTIADFGPNGIVISESRDAILNEIDGFKKLSERALADRPRHEQIVEACSRMQAELNPAIKREAEQADEIARLKKGMAELTDSMEDIKGMLAKALKSKAKED